MSSVLDHPWTSYSIALALSIQLQSSRNRGCVPNVTLHFNTHIQLQNLLTVVEKIVNTFFAFYHLPVGINNLAQSFHYLSSGQRQQLPTWTLIPHALLSLFALLANNRETVFTWCKSGHTDFLIKVLQHLSDVYKPLNNSSGCMAWSSIAYLHGAIFKYFLLLMPQSFAHFTHFL